MPDQPEGRYRVRRWLRPPICGVSDEAHRSDGRVRDHHAGRSHPRGRRAISERGRLPSRSDRDRERATDHGPAGSHVAAVDGTHHDHQDTEPGRLGRDHRDRRQDVGGPLRAGPGPDVRGRGDHAGIRPRRRRQRPAVRFLRGGHRADPLRTRDRRGPRRESVRDLLRHRAGRGLLGRRDPTRHDRQTCGRADLSHAEAEARLCVLLGGRLRPLLPAHGQPWLQRVRLPLSDGRHHGHRRCVHDLVRGRVLRSVSHLRSANDHRSHRRRARIDAIRGFAVGGCHRGKRSSYQTSAPRRFRAR